VIDPGFLNEYDSALITLLSGSRVKINILPVTLCVAKTASEAVAGSHPFWVGDW
jgi:hypothetical protein